MATVNALLNRPVGRGISRVKGLQVGREGKLGTVYYPIEEVGLERYEGVNLDFWGVLGERLTYEEAVVLMHEGGGVSRYEVR